MPFLSCRASAQEGEILVGLYDNPPKIFRDENNNAAGIFPELLLEIAKLENLNIKFVYCDWQDCIRMVQSGELDLLPDVARTEERAAFFEFHSKPALTSWSVIYRSADVEAESILDLEGRRIAVLEGSVQATYLENTTSSFNISAQFVPVSSFDQAVQEVQTGNADMIAVNHFYGGYAARQKGLVETPIVFMPISLFFAAGSGTDREILDQIDFHLDQWQGDDTSPLFQILRKWTSDGSFSAVPDYVWWAMVFISMCALLTLTLASYFKRQLKYQTAKVIEGEQKLDLILNDVGSGVFIKDSHLRYIYVNDAMCNVLGRPKNEILGKVDADLYDPVNSQGLSETDRNIIEHDTRYTGREVVSISSSELPRTFFSVKKPIHDANDAVVGLCGIITDITDELDFRNRLEILSHYDALTGLLNKSKFIKQSEQWLKEFSDSQTSFAVLIMNLDNFKAINNSAGYQVGDELLQKVAFRLSVIARDRYLLARTNGDSFALLMTDLPSSNSEVDFAINTLKDQIQKSIARPIRLREFNYYSTASIGISIFTPNLIGIEQAMKQAELALYAAKKGSRGSTRIFEREMEHLAQERMQLEAELHSAVENNEFVVFFQPQVDVSGTLLGIEALIRWKHPKHGICPPSFFLGLAERSGIMAKIGDFVLESACQQLETWARSSKTDHLVVAVNISSAEFYQEYFVDHVSSLLERFNFNPERLEFELTEELFIRDFDEGMSKIDTLKKLGIRTSIDDFGTGYSSLSRLKLLPLDQLKIDASFVRELVSSAENAAIVKAILDLSEALNVEVIAEG